MIKYKTHEALAHENYGYSMRLLLFVAEILDAGAAVIRMGASRRTKWTCFECGAQGASTRDWLAHSCENDETRRGPRAPHQDLD